MPKREKTLEWDDADLDALSEITPEDIQDATVSAPPKLRALLEAEPEQDDAD